MVNSINVYLRLKKLCCLKGEGIFRMRCLLVQFFIQLNWFDKSFKTIVWNPFLVKNNPLKLSVRILKNSQRLFCSQKNGFKAFCYTNTNDLLFLACRVVVIKWIAQYTHLTRSGHNTTMEESHNTSAILNISGTSQVVGWIDG